ncbi:hypothetical protein [Terriglobus saanensis]|uniref:hypothetical protein n=1 Tax=Terriglobus saanensis TaxID=870903 RepID=UPI0002D797C9|nr:hypothetical protein [Terriglobus saanensis]
MQAKWCWPSMVMKEDIFVFRDVLGTDFTSERFSAVTTLGMRLKNGSEMVDPPASLTDRRTWRSRRRV